MPDRKGFPHSCGSAAPSLARTLCSYWLVRLWHEKASLLMAGARSGKVCLIAKGSRIHADRPRHPWRGRFALQAYHSFPVGLNHCCNKIERNVRQKERVGSGSDSAFYSQFCTHRALKYSLRRYKKEGMAGSGVKRPPHGCGGRAYREVFTATLRNARHFRLNSTVYLKVTQN